MVMVRLNHVTTQHDPRYYQTHADVSLIAPKHGATIAGTHSHIPSQLQNLPAGIVKPTGAKVLDDLSLTILSGDTLSVVGPSGCGKSTLLRLIAGLILPESGESYFDGEPMNACSPRDRHIGMVFQNYALYPHMAVQENMGFFWRLRRHRKQEITDRVRQTAQLLKLDVDTLLGRLPRHLAGGEQQRVAVGRCLSCEPAVFLLDEPFSNLDAHLREHSRRDVKKLLTMLAVTTVFVTHDQHEAIAMADRLAVMCDGKIVQVGTYDEMYKDPLDSFVAGFLGDPPINLLACRYNADRQELTGEGHLQISLCGGHSPAHGDEVLLGIRPEHVHLTSALDGGAMRAESVISSPALPIG